MNVDVLVVGSGIAGLVSVAIVTKKGRLDSSTDYAQGGISAVFDPDDTSDLHVADTLVAGWLLAGCWGGPLPRRHGPAARE